MAWHYFSGVSAGMVAGLNGDDITNSAPKWVRLGLGLSFAISKKFGKKSLEIKSIEPFEQIFKNKMREIFERTLKEIVQRKFNKVLVRNIKKVFFLLV